MIKAQNSWVAGQINPNLALASNNNLYFSAALNIRGMFITKTNTLRRINSTAAIPFDVEPDQPFERVVTSTYDNEGYYVGWYTDNVDSFYNVYTFGNDELVFQNQFILTGYTQPYLDYVNFDDKVVYTYDDRAPRTLTFTDTTPSGFVDFEFSVQPTTNFDKVDYSNFNFNIGGDVNVITVKVTGTNVATLITDDWIGGMLFSLGLDSSEAAGQGNITARTVINPNEIDLEMDVLSTFDAGDYKGSRVVLQQPIFFSDDEYPKVVGYYASRLYFGRTKSLPLLVAGSRINIANNFNVGKSLPADAIVFLMNTGKGSTYIQHIVGHTALFLFTDSSERIIIPSIETGITQETFITQNLSDHGSHTVTPKIYDNYLIFIDKTRRKIMRISHSNANTYSVFEVSRGMDISEDIESMGSVDDQAIDTKLLAFSYANSQRISFITLQQEADIFGRVEYDLLPEGSVTVAPVQFNQIENKTIITAFEQSNSLQLGNLVFGTITTGLTRVRAVSNPSVAPLVRSWLYNSTDNAYRLAPAGVITEVPSGFDFIGDATNFYIRSMPLVDQFPQSWDYKKISYVFVSYYRSARFDVNGYAVAYPTVEEIAVNESPLKTGYEKLTENTNGDLFKYIEISGSEPYNVEIQAYGYDVRSKNLT